MDIKKFTEFFVEISDHNFQLQKKLEQEDKILTVRTLKSVANEFPLAEIYLHYPSDTEASDLEYCYSLSENNCSQFLPVLSIFSSPEKIILSYLSQENLNQLNFEDSLPIHEHRMNSFTVIKNLSGDNSFFTPQLHSMIFIEHIPDTLNWKSDSKEHKIYQAFSMSYLHHFMTWNSFYFTPHY